jgi:glycosyltransferase involved in cell wall biosynthesis
MKFSIITINYNNKEGLERTIQSILGQTFQDYQFIIIDGGSTDGSVDIIKQNTNHIDYWVSESDGGRYPAMNKGIKLATGEYLNFMNSGDCFYAPDVLEKVSKYGYTTDFIVGKDYHYNEKSQQGHASIQPPRTTMIHFFMATLDHQSTFIKRELFKDSPYDESHRLVSDWIFFTEKIVKEGKRVQFIPDIICRREEGGLSEQQWQKNRKEINDYLHKFLPDGVYQDYATLGKLDKTSIYRLFEICDNPKTNRILTFVIKLLWHLFNNSCHHSILKNTK